MPHPICQQIWMTQECPHYWKSSVFNPIPKKDNIKECSSYCTTAFTSHASKVTLKILQTRLQEYRNCELPEIQAWFTKSQRNQRSNCWHLLDHRKINRVPIKYLFLLYWLRQSLWLCGTQQLGKILRDGNTRLPDLPLEKSVCKSICNSLNWIWNNRLAPNRKRSTSILYVVTLLI